MHEVGFDLLILLAGIWVIAVTLRPLGLRLEVAEVRIHAASPRANKTLAHSGIQADTGAHVVGQWVDDALESPPAAEQLLQSGMILVAAGSPDSMKRLSDVVRPITQDGTMSSPSNVPGRSSWTRRRHSSSPTPTRFTSAARSRPSTASTTSSRNRPRNH
jgi:hypothetical protein